MSDKWKQLIDLVVNEEEDKASELFHEIVIESSREIYGNLITSEEAIDEVNSDDVDEFINDIEADQEGVRTEDDDIEDDAEELESELDIEEPSDADHEEAEIEDRVVDLEDEIEALKQEFEALINDDDGDEAPEDETDIDPEMEESVATEEDAIEEAEEVAEEIVEYTENVPAPKGGNDDVTKSPVAKSGKGGIKNASSTEEKGGATPKSQDMGGTTKPDLKKV